MRDASEAYRRPSNPLGGLIGDSESMRELRRTILRYAPIPAPVLITGETGSGKELVARALHDASGRSGPFVAVNAAAIPGTLAATELFGHERGAFTGADRRHVGAFEQADEGTLFLDEIGELPLDLQAWLLRVLETGEVRALGAKTPRAVDARVITATHVDLEQAVRRGRFRADLYFRLNVLAIQAPALRDRLDDLRAIATHLLGTLGLEHRHELSPTAIQALALHDWPGNVRELRAVLLRAVANADAPVLDAADIVRATQGFTVRPRRSRMLLDPTMVAEAVADSKGNVTEAARRLGVPRSTLRHYVRVRAS
ncbi:MAG: sigma-54 dependent transcriptional regulator [Sandaracinaceae bacterium]|nr:sigma-54 dependent transcriptional regulator [Sandaracinaceae bacterium]